jgi:hypothetical protein
MSYSPLIELDPDTLVDTRTTAAMLKPAPSTHANRRSTGAKHRFYIKVARQVRYRVADLLDFIESNTVK